VGMGLPLLFLQLPLLKDSGLATSRHVGRNGRRSV